MASQTLIIFLLGAAGAGGLLWVLVYPSLSGERNAEKRKETVARPSSVPRAQMARVGVKSRREQLEETLKDVEERRRKSNRPGLSVRIAQAGLDWSKRQFFLISAATGVGAFALGLLLGVGPLPALLLGFAGAFGAPRWFLGFLKKRREKRFLEVFPDAVDVIVRGIKAGLPLADCLRIIANETQEPVRSEFRAIIEAQAIGIPIGEACVKLAERMPLPEANFFGIVVSIQQKSGGNLSEALGNLSNVLRERKRMAAKIQAMSMEAKASASIIGSLPVLVLIMVYLTNPEYIQLMWTTPFGRIMLVACAVWMMLGALVMRKMINFEF